MQSLFIIEDPTSPGTRLHRALELVAQAVTGRDLDGKPAILHSLMVYAAAVNKHPTLDDIQITALLDDVLEETTDDTITAELITRLFGPWIGDAVVALTHREDETYMDYIRRLSRNSMALEVKLLDIGVNFHRMKTLDSAQHVDWHSVARAGRYQKAYDFLMSVKKRVIF